MPPLRTGLSRRKDTDMTEQTITARFLAQGSDVSSWREIDESEIPEEPSERPRTFSKLRIVTALTELGVWGDVKSFIEGNGLYDIFLAAQDFREDNEFFVRGKAALQEELGWTDEQVEVVLESACA